MPKSMRQPCSIPKWPNKEAGGKDQTRFVPDLTLPKRRFFGISFMFSSSSTPKHLSWEARAWLHIYWPTCMRRRGRSTNAPGACSRLPSKTTAVLSRPRVRASEKTDLPEMDRRQNTQLRTIFMSSHRNDREVSENRNNFQTWILKSRLIQFLKIVPKQC